MTLIRANIQTKWLGVGSGAKPPGCEFMGMGEAWRTRRLSEILYMSDSVDQISRPEWISQGGVLVSVFSALLFTSNNDLLSPLYPCNTRPLRFSPSRDSPHG